MRETPEDVRQRLTREAEARLTQRLQKATSVNVSDGALQDHKWAIRRIDALTDAELTARAREVEDQSKSSSD